MDILLGFTVSIVQLSLILLALLVGFCEVTTYFSNSGVSTTIRFVIGISLLILSYYAKYLLQAPHIVSYCLLVVTLAATFYVSKYIILQYNNRKRQKEIWENVKSSSGGV